MIDEDLTWKFYGYHSSSLSHSSHKLIVAVCEECFKPRALKFRDYKDYCVDCTRYINGMMQIGRRASLETREKMRYAHKGKHSGAHSNFWKGGIAPWRNQLWSSNGYHNWRTTVFKRDDYTCQMCHERGGKLEAHHIRPVRDHKNDLLIFDINNGITLCKTCHRSIRGKEHDYTEQFEGNLYIL